MNDNESESGHIDSEEQEEQEEQEEKEEDKETQQIININEEEKKAKKEQKKSKIDKKGKNNKTSKRCNGIFINGIPYETTEDELRELFSPYGNIEIIKLPKYQDSGRNIGYCHIYYTSPDSASKALELDNYTLGKRYLNVSLANKNSDELNENEKINPNDVPIDCITAFIRNLPYEATEKEVGDKFRSCGKIKEIRFVYNSQTKKFKGFCYIDFKEHKGLLKALKLNGCFFEGRKLYVDYEQGKPKRTYKGYEETQNEDANFLNKKRY